MTLAASRSGSLQSAKSPIDIVGRLAGAHAGLEALAGGVLHVA
jgi:hypothetical protein